MFFRKRKEFQKENPRTKKISTENSVTCRLGKTRQILTVKEINNKSNLGVKNKDKILNL